MPPWATLSPLECSEGVRPKPRGERSRVPKPRELASLEDDVGRGHDVDALQAAQGVDPLLPPGLGHLVGHQLLQAPLVFFGLSHRVDVEGECVIVRLLPKRNRLYPGPVGTSPVALSSTGCVDLVEDQPVAQQELGEPLLLTLQVFPGVVQGAHQVASGLTSSSGTHTSTTLPTESILARNSASLRSFSLRLSAAGFIILETAPMTQSTPRAVSFFCRSNPVTPDSYTHLVAGSMDRIHSATAQAS